MENPILQFDFHEKPLLFTKPKELIIAQHPNEIFHCFEKVERAVQNGYYVAGYISYEVAYALYKISNTKTGSMPLIWFGVFEAPLSHSTDDSGSYTVSDWKMKQSKQDYNNAFQRIIDAINRQETEQVNYTVSFEAKFSGNAFPYYSELKRAQNSKYSAFLNIGHHQILSVSPELFFELKNDAITMKPMKGTISRGKTYEEDIRNKQWLAQSEKNKHENKLITNLMYNEIKQITEEETIHVPNKFTIEKYPTVYQMTSTIVGQLLPEITATDVLKALFPCGSISGVPKVETLQLIAELESEPRDVYCGAIGYITPHQEAIFNVPIRTVIIDKNNHIARYGAGGAITNQSVMEDEYEEVLTKTKVLSKKDNDFQLIETFGLYDGEYIVFNEHMNRLKNSASYFDFNLNLEQIKRDLLDLANERKEGRWRVRLLVDRSNHHEMEVKKLDETLNNIIVLAKNPIDKNNLFFYHKTTNRSIYDNHKQEDVFDVLLWNENEEITEFTIGNIVVEINGELVTPPVTSGLLPGTFREKLLREGKVKERIIYKSDLVNCSKIWLINSVRQWVEVKFQNTVESVY